MPPTTNTNSAALAVEISSPTGLPLTANGPLIGNVVRRSALVSPQATVTLTLYGRAKSKITVRRAGNNSSHRDTYRGRVNFFAGAPRHEIHHIVFQGPLHIPGGGAVEAWPFEMRIPAGPMIALGSDEMDMKETSLLSLEPQDVVHHALPGTFSSADYGYRTSSEAYVEYHLEAVMRYTHGGSAETIVATCPFPIMQQGTPESVSDFHMTRRTFNQSVRSYHLVPGMEDASLSFKQKTLQAFSSSKVPVYHFHVQVDTPRILQLDSPVPMPLGLRVVPKPEVTSSIIEGVSYPVTVTSASVRIKRQVLVVAPGNWSGRRHDGIHKFDTHLGLENAFRMVQEPIVLPAGENETPLDLGTVLQLSIKPDGLYAAGTRLARVSAIEPDYCSYTMQQTSIFKWSFTIMMGGKERTINVETPTAVLGPPQQFPFYNMQTPTIEPAPAPLYTAAPVEDAPAYKKAPPTEQAPAYSEITPAAGPSNTDASHTTGADMDKKVVDTN